MYCILIKKQEYFLFTKQNFWPDKRHPGHRSRYEKYGPRSGYGFLPTACQPIGARGVVILFPTLGLSWGFSVIAVNQDALVWKYLFAIFTSLQVRKKN
jgi:hypothetical protein